MNDDLSRRLILIALLGSFVALAFAVLYRFLIPVAWAAILAYVTWPAFVRVERLVAGRRTMAALLMTLALGLAFVLPLIFLIGLVRAELPTLYRGLSEQLAAGPLPLPDFLRDVPYLGSWLDSYLQKLAVDPQAIRGQLQDMLSNSADEITQVVGGVGRNIAKFAIALLTVFFFFRDGERVFAQIQRVLRRFLGTNVDNYLQAVGRTTKAVVYGLVLTALAQGLLAGVGYWGAGITTPVLLGAVTTLVALIPFGTPFVWGGAGVWLLLSGHTWQGVGLLLWGTLVVSWVDNIIRPLVISQATDIPYLIVLFGVLGGVASFGLIGLFVGPVILVVLMAIWREWQEDSLPAR